MTWVQLADSPVFDNSWIAAIAPGGPGLIAVGYTLEEPWPAEWHSDIAVWVSADAREWQRVDTGALSAQGTDEYLVELTEGPNLQLMALGFTHTNPTNVYTDSNPTAYTSSDGLTWSALGSPPPGPALPVETGFIATGTGPLLFSPDGVSWNPIDDPDFDRAEVYSLGHNASGYVAVGRVGFDTPTSAIWTSSDGIEWDRIEDDIVSADRQFEQVSAEPGGSRFIAFGWSSTLVSNDGRNWKSADLLDDTPAPNSTAVWDEDRLVIVGTTWSPSGPGVWASDNGGLSIGRVETPETNDTADMADVISFEGTFVGVGGLRGFPQVGQIMNGDPMLGADGRGVVWIGHWN